MPAPSSLLARLDNKHSNIHKSGLVGILLVGLLLRWYALYAGHGYIYFAIRDEVMALKYALDFLAGISRTFYLGQPALNHGNIPGPLWAMFVAFIYKLGVGSSEGPLYIVMLINSIVIYPFYLLACKMLPPRYALLSALFYALAPWAIYYSAGIYNPMLLAMLGVLLFLALWQTLEHDASRSVFWVMLLSAAIPQFHMIGIFYYPAILLLLFYSPAKLNRRWLLFGIVAGVALYIPYIVGESLHHWSNFRHVLIGDGKKFSPGVLKIITIPIAMLSNNPGRWSGFHITEFTTFANKWFGSYILLILINLVSFFLAILFIYFFVKYFYRILRTSGFHFRAALAQYRAPVFLGTLLIIPLLCYLPTGKDYATRYSIFIFPLLFLLPGYYFSECKKQHFKKIMSYVLSVTFLCNIYLVYSFYTNLHRQLTSGPLFMPAFYKLSKLKTALAKNAGGIKNVEIDASQYHDRDRRYDAIITTAIKTYIAAYQDYSHTPGNTVHVQHYLLLDPQANTPANADLVYRANGLLVYKLAENAR